MNISGSDHRPDSEEQRGPVFLQLWTFLNTQYMRFFNLMNHISSHLVRYTLQTDNLHNHFCQASRIPLQYFCFYWDV